MIAGAARSRQWLLWLPGGKQPMRLGFILPVDEANARRRARELLVCRVLPNGTRLTPDPLSNMKR